MTQSLLRGHGYSRPTVTCSDHVGRSVGSTCVLMIDDDRSARETFGIMLADAGYDFVGAENGCDGIRLAEACQPGVAIVDLRLPDLSGIDVLSMVRNLSPLTVLVLLT